MSALEASFISRRGTYLKGSRYATMPVPSVVNAAAGAASKNGIIMLSWFEVVKAHTFTGYAIKVRTTGGNIRIGLFNDGVDGAVGQAVIAATDTASVAVGSGSAEQVISQSMPLNPGIYWCGYQLSSASAVLDGWNLSPDGSRLVGCDAAGSGGATFPQITQAYGAFPGTLGNIDASPWALSVWPINLIA